MAKSPAWQRKEGKNPDGGLNAKGRASYNKANPGKPGLKAPQPEGGPRKDSFCARMEGMKKKLTSGSCHRSRPLPPRVRLPVSGRLARPSSWPRSTRPQAGGTEIESPSEVPEGLDRSEVAHQVRQAIVQDGRAVPA